MREQRVVTLMRCEAGCRRPARTLWWREDIDHSIELCGIDSDRLAPALVDQGYQQVYDERLESSAHPSLGAVTSDPVTH